MHWLSCLCLLQLRLKYHQDHVMITANINTRIHCGLGFVNTRLVPFGSKDEVSLVVCQVIWCLPSCSGNLVRGQCIGKGELMTGGNSRTLTAVIGFYQAKMSQLYQPTNCECGLILAFQSARITSRSFFGVFLVVFCSYHIALLLHRHHSLVLEHKLEWWYGSLVVQWCV